MQQVDLYLPRAMRVYICVRFINRYAYQSLHVSLYCCRAIQNYELRYSNDGGFEITAFLGAIGDFIGIFSLSLLVGALMGCLTALISFSNTSVLEAFLCILVVDSYAWHGRKQQVRIVRADPEILSVSRLLSYISN